MNWHVPPEMLTDYDRGRLDAVRVMAVETHVARCATCRSALPADEGWLADGWTAVLDVVDAPRRGVLERLLHRVGLPGHRARLLAATPALQWSWLLSTVAVLAFAVAAAHLTGGGDGPALMLFLVVAPVLPVLAVSTAYGAPVDPLHEVSATTPMAGPGLLLWRASAVLTVSTAMGLAAAWFLPARGWAVVAWLLPALALCLAALALSTVLPLPTAAGVLGCGWLLTVGAATVLSAGRAEQLFGLTVQHRVFGPGAQLCYLLAALAAGAVLTVRRRRLDLGEPR